MQTADDKDDKGFREIDVLGFPVADVDMDEAVTVIVRLLGREGMAREGVACEGVARKGMAREGVACEGMARGGMAREGMARVVTANPEIMYRAWRDPSLGKLLRDADLILPDGIGVVKASAMLGRPLKTRVAGADLVAELVAFAEARGYSVYLLGASRESVTGAIAALEKKHPALNIVGWHDGFFDSDEKEAILSEIQEKRPDFLFIGMGFPAEHIFAMEHKSRLPVGVMIGVGGTIDAISGVVKRAPRWIQRLNLEWAYRFAQNPRRLKRFWTLPAFMIEAFRQKRRESRA